MNTGNNADSNSLNPNIKPPRVYRLTSEMIAHVDAWGITTSVFAYVVHEYDTCVARDGSVKHDDGYGHVTLEDVFVTENGMRFYRNPPIDYGGGMRHAIRLNQNNSFFKTPAGSFWVFGPLSKHTRFVDTNHQPLIFGGTS